jgi:hypothetical protein
MSRLFGIARALCTGSTLTRRPGTIAACRGLHFESVGAAAGGLAQAGYLADEAIATTIFLAARQQPVRGSDRDGGVPHCRPLGGLRYTVGVTHVISAHQVLVS